MRTRQDRGVISVERVPGSDPVARELVAAMVGGLDALYADRPQPRASATPEELSPPDGAYVVLREDGRPVAGGGIKRLAPGIAEIKRMYVVPEARSRGHARRLLAELERVAADAGYWRVRLDTGPEQPHARALYESAGYRSVADYNGNTYASYWGEKDLPAVIPARFNGPPASGHGGYSSWLAARYLDVPGETTLHRPPPLERPLQVVRDGDAVLLVGHAAGADDDGPPETVLSARPWAGEVEPPAQLDPAAAHAARDPSRWAAEQHPFPTCFACGPSRDDGFSLFTGPLGDGRYATDWTPPPDCPEALVWVALDCPSSAPIANPGWTPPVVLARFGVEVRSLPPAEPHAMVARATGSDGRKRATAVALYAADGELRAVAHALWIELRT
jgi:GNAT superfamily N-acetyltransferase